LTEIKGKMDGRKSLGQMRPEVVELTRKLRKPTRSGKQRSLREISAELAAGGFVAEMLVTDPKRTSVD
jgi:hypothetical protein